LARAPAAFRQTLHFVLHPDSSFELTDVPSAINALSEDSPLTRSVVGALPSQHIFGRAVEAASDAEAGDFTLKVSVAPGSTLIDATIRGHDREAVGAVAKALAPAAFAYVDTTYQGYELTLLGTEAAPEPTWSGELSLVGLAAAFGFLLGAAVIFAQGVRSSRQSLGRRKSKPSERKPRSRGAARRRAAPRKSRTPAATRANGTAGPDPMRELQSSNEDRPNGMTSEDGEDQRNLDGSLDSRPPGPIFH
jgi:hypothetical protein